MTQHAQMWYDAEQFVAMFDTKPKPEAARKAASSEPSPKPQPQRPDGPDGIEAIANCYR